MARYAARLLAPLALAAVAVGVYLIVDSNTGSTQSSTHTRTRSHTTTRRTGTRAPRKPSFYIVRSGDTLSAIAGRTNVPLNRLTALNPSLVPPYALTTGQRLRLRR